LHHSRPALAEGVEPLTKISQRFREERNRADLSSPTRGEVGGASRPRFNRDVVTDSSHVDDTFRLENAVMTALGTHTGALNPASFFAGAAAHDKATGVLFYDANGSPAGGVRLLATLVNKPTLQTKDFLVI
jgi:hypothetical protein